MRPELTTKPRTMRTPATTRTNHSLTIFPVRLLSARKARLSALTGVRSARLTVRHSAIPALTDVESKFVDDSYLAICLLTNDDLLLASVDAAGITRTSTIAVQDKEDTVEVIPTIVRCAIIATRTPPKDATSRRTPVKATVSNLRVSRRLSLQTNFLS